MRLWFFTLSMTLLLPVGAGAQQTPATYTLVTGVQRMYERVRQHLLEAAEQMPAADFGFRPAEGSRSYGELFTHVASAQFSRCAGIHAETNPRQGFDFEALTAKPEVVEVLRNSFAYCDPAYASLTAANQGDLVQGAGWQRNSQVERGFALADNVTHDNEMYGTAAVYLRMKGIVPPSTAAR
jgi:hypothetical protein